jgi:hypothetical protein
MYPYAMHRGTKDVESYFMAKLIELTQGQLAIVDDEDYDRVSKHKWYAYWGLGTYYAKGWIDYETGQESMHRFIMNAKKGQLVDHINRWGLDNRKFNLRFSNPKQNNDNRHRSGRFMGVSKCQKGGWGARAFGVNLGIFDTEIEAALAYDNRVKEIYGDKAVLNIVDAKGVQI